MKSISLIVGIIILVLTIGIGLLLDSVGDVSLIVAGGVVISTTILLFIASNCKMKSAFKVSLPFSISFLGVIEYVLAFFVGDTLKNNGFFIAILICFVLQVCLILITSQVSKISDER